MDEFVEGLHKRWFALLGVILFVELLNPEVVSPAAAAYVSNFWFYEIFVSTGKLKLTKISLVTGFIADSWHRIAVMVLLAIQTIIATALIPLWLGPTKHFSASNPQTVQQQVIYYHWTLLSFVNLFTIVLIYASLALDPYGVDVDESAQKVATFLKKGLRFYVFASIHFGLDEGGQQAADRLKVRLEEEDIGLVIIDTSLANISPLVFDALELCDAFMVFGVSLRLRFYRGCVMIRVPSR